jgi:hypothetical protein
MAGPPAPRTAAAGVGAETVRGLPAASVEASGEAQVFIQPGPARPVADRLAGAQAEGKARGWQKGFWFGYGIRRLMGEHSWMGWHPWGGPETHLTLDDIINGRKTVLEKKVAADQAARGTAASMPDLARAFAAGREGEGAERQVLKDIGLLFRMLPGEGTFPADIRVTNLSLPFDLEDLPFVWGGMAADAESLAYLIPLYARASAGEDKRSLLWAVGLHRDPASVVPFVERILAGREDEETRAEAVSCLGEQNDPRALELLLRTIKNDRSEEVREHALEGLAEMDLPAAEAALIELAFGGSERSLRRRAVRGLADKASAATIGALEKISLGDKDREVQEEAIRAMADLPGTRGLAHLARLVKTHQETSVRLAAVEAIGGIGGPEAVKILTEWAKGRGR